MSARRRRQKAERKARNALACRALDRNEARALAQEIVDKTDLPIGVRIVVAVTDASGQWVGVGSNTNLVDVEAILTSALVGADKISVPRSIIETEGEEA